MEHMGWWSIVPPVLTILLALATKDVVLSLFLGVLSGTLIASGGNLFAAVMLFGDKLVENLGDGWNLRIFLFCALLGALVGLMARAGSSRAFGDWASAHIKTRTGTLLATWLFGVLVFIDDYFNSLAVGTAMRPVSDRMKISRAKLAYILDSTAAPVCILAPVSTWVVTVMSYMRGAEGFDKLGMSELELFIRTIPYNLYALFAIVMVLAITLTKRDFGPMLAAELRARGDGPLYDADTYGAVAGDMEETHGVPEGEPRTSVRPLDMVLPMLLLVGSAIVAFPVTTWWAAAGSEGGPATFMEAMRSISLHAAFVDSDASVALMLSIVVTLAVSYPYMLARRLFTMRVAGEAFTSGIQSMVPALIILSMAWTIGAVIKGAPGEGGLGLPKFIAELVQRSGMTGAFLPLGLFLISGVIAFSTGTSWGTMAIMIPIGMPIAIAIAETAGSPELMLPAVLSACGAVMGGAVLGDHTSPISDTTILSSIGAGCPLLEHVTTQAPYAIFVAVCAGVGYVVGGLSHSAMASLAVTAALFATGLFLLPRLMPGGGKDA
jgi:tetracycline resistance efflux pump